MKNTQNYISSLTPLRGIAALWVVLFHIDVSTYYRDLGSIIPRESTGLLSKGYLWVDFFFLLSGFIIYHVYGDTLKGKLNSTKIKSFLWSRFSRLYPLHLFTLCFLILLSKILEQTTPQLMEGSWELYFSDEALPCQFFMFNAMNYYHFLSWNMPSWSIGAEWWTYCCSLLFIGVIGKQNNLIRILTTILSFSGLSALVYFHPNHNLDITWDYGFLRCLFQFIIGINIYQFYDQKIGFGLLSKDYVFIVLFVLIAVGFHFQIYDLLFVPIFALLLLSTAYNNGKVKNMLEQPILKYLGEISYSIYLMHGLVFFLFWFQFPLWKAEYGLGHLSFIQQFIYYIIFLSLTISASMGSHKYIEVKARKWMRKVKK